MPVDNCRALGSLNPRTSRQGAKIVIERAVFLHEEDHVLDITQRRGRRLGRSARRTFGGSTVEANAAAVSRAVFPRSRRRVIVVYSIIEQSLYSWRPDPNGTILSFSTGPPTPW